MAAPSNQVNVPELARKIRDVSWLQFRCPDEEVPNGTQGPADFTISGPGGRRTVREPLYPPIEWEITTHVAADQRLAESVVTTIITHGGTGRSCFGRQGIFHVFEFPTPEQARAAAAALEQLT